MQHPIQRGTNSPCIQTHEILNKSIMCRQTNNKQENCLILSITHNTMKLKICQLHTHTQNIHTRARARARAHAHTNTQLTHFEPSIKRYTYIISHSQMCFYAARFLGVNASIICKCDCCRFHNDALLSAITPRHVCVTVGFFFTHPVLNSIPASVSVCSHPSSSVPSSPDAFYLSAHLHTTNQWIYANTLYIVLMDELRRQQRTKRKWH